jgi:hypothetical protein
MFNAIEVAIEEFLRQNVAPERVFQKRHADVWRTLAAPVDFADPSGGLQWLTVKQSEFVRVALHPYQIQGNTPPQAAIGGLALASLVTPQLGPCEEVIWFVGSPNQVLPDGTTRLWLNVAVRYARKGGE